MLSSIKSFFQRVSLPRQKRRCPHSLVAKKRWAPLVRWCRVLRGRLSVAYTSEPDQDGLSTSSRFKALVLTLDESEDAISPRLRRKIRDATELVLLALQLDPSNAWEQVVRVLCGTSDFFPASHLACELEPRLSVRHVAYGTFQYDSIDVYSSMWTDKTRSGSYNRTRQWLERNCQGAVVSTTNPVPLKLHLTPTLVDMSRGSKQYLERCIALVQHLQNQSSASSLFCIDAISLDVRALDIDTKCGRLLRVLQSTGVRIDSLLFCPVVADLALQDDSLDVILNDPVNPVENLVAENSCGLASPCFWRALRSAQALKKLEVWQCIKGSPEERRRMAMWQAYSLLDPRSPTSIESVSITDGIISRSAITSMLSILTSEDPATLLGIRRHEASRNDPTSKRLRFLQLPMSPGSDEEVDEIIELLACVGHHLETLVLSVDRWVLQDNDIVKLFKACPGLRRLRLQRAQLQSVDCIVTAYERGLCSSLESLAFEDSVVHEKASLIHLLHTCNDNKHPIHLTLKDFIYDNYLHENIMGEIIPLIGKNTSLRHIGVRITPFGMERHRFELKKLHLAPIPVQQKPLPMDNRLALFHALQPRLNVDVCHHILGFAGEPARRKVICFMYDWIRLPNRFEM